MCEAARAKGRGYASEKAGFGNTHFQSGTDLVGGVDNEVGVVATFPAPSAYSASSLRFLRSL